MEMHKFTAEDTVIFKINPHPDRGEGLEVGFRDDGLVGIWMVADRKTSFCLSCEAAIQLSELIRIEVGALKINNNLAG